MGEWIAIPLLALAAEARGMERAAEIAEPQQRRDSNGLWVQRRRKIVEAIRAAARELKP